MDSSPSKPSFIERLSAFLMREPEDREALLAQLHSAFERSLLDAEALAIIEGALKMSDLCVSDVMIPRAQMDVININAPLEQIVDFVIHTGHSRFPAIGEGKDDVVGVLLAKDLLRYFAGAKFDLRSILRPAVFVPESKRLNVLLREFRVSHNHLAIVVDEYGSIAGLVSIEDVLEQIVGEIEDEYDLDDDSDNICQDPNGRYQVKATTEIAALNSTFDTDFSDDEVDTVGGLILQSLGRLPKRGEQIMLGELKVQILRADNRRIYTLLIDPPQTTTPHSAGQ